MRAYPQDLRQQVLRAVDEGISRVQIMDLFQVLRATIKRYVKQRRETGTVRPRPIPGRPPKKGVALQRAMQELLEAHPEASQQEDCQCREAQHGTRGSQAWMCRAQHAVAVAP